MFDGNASEIASWCVCFDDLCFVNRLFFLQGEVLMLCKGAESHVLDRVASGPVDETRTHIDEYAEVNVVFLSLPKGKKRRPLMG